MAAAVLGEMGKCWRALGRWEKAAHCYEQASQESNQAGDQRSVAISKGELGTVRMLQRRYPEALAAYQEARERFTQLNEPSTLAVYWQQTGMVYARMQDWAQAEAACQESLKIQTNLNNKPGVASTLDDLGSLFNVQGRLEEAVTYYRKAADLYILLKNKNGEGKVCNNLADTLVQLGRLEEARQEILHAIECREPFGQSAELWKSYEILANLETADGHPEAASEARLQARRLFLQYRRDGGESHFMGAEWCQGVASAIQQGAEQSAQEKLKQVAHDPQLKDHYLKTLIPVLLAILSGERAATLADTPGLYYRDAAEVELLLEHLRNGD